MGEVRVWRGNTRLTAKMPAFAKERRFGGCTERHGDEPIRIWEGIWVMGLAKGTQMIERAVRGRGRWENTRKGI